MNNIRFKIAFAIAGVGMVVEAIGALGLYVAGIDSFDTVLVVGATIGMVSYLFAGIVSAIRIAFSIVIWPFTLFLPLLVQVFGLAFTITAAFIVVVFLPIIPVYFSWKRYGNHTVEDAC